MNGNGDIIRRGSAAKFLSKEQRDWLIEKFRETNHMRFKAGTNEDIRHSFILEEDVKQIINQCTEKEFPEFHFLDRNEVPYSVGHAQFYKMVVISPLNSLDVTLAFRPEEFKQFTAGCNKIVEWLDEQQPEPMDIYNCNNDMEDK